MGIFISLILVIALAITAIVGVTMSGVAIHRTSQMSSGGIGGGDTVTTNGVQTLTNKTLISPSVSGLTLSGPPPSGVTIQYDSSWHAITTPTLAAGSKDMAGTILSDGDDQTPPSVPGFTITVTFSTPYPQVPTLVLVTVVNGSMTQQGPPTVTWTAANFTLSYASLHDPITHGGSSVPFWTYLVL